MISGKHNNTGSKINLLKPEEIKIAIVISEWNNKITDALCAGALKILTENGIIKSNIVTHYVPGSFELPLGAQLFCETGEYDSVLCLGCVIQGETRHFEFISNAVADGIMRVGLDYNIPVIFGVLTTDTFEQALARSVGEMGNKGEEAAIAALKMISLSEQILS